MFWKLAIYTENPDERQSVRFVIALLSTELFNRDSKAKNVYQSWLYVSIAKQLQQCGHRYQSPLITTNKHPISKNRIDVCYGGAPRISPGALDCQAKDTPLSSIGKLATRRFELAAIALASAGAAGGVAGSPTPLGASADGIICTSIALMSLIRSGS